jgi:glutamate racemase
MMRRRRKRRRGKKTKRKNDVPYGNDQAMTPYGNEHQSELLARFRFRLCYSLLE